MWNFLKFCKYIYSKIEQSFKVFKDYYHYYIKSVLFISVASHDF